MLGTPITRRLVTVPGVVVGFLVVSLFLPVLLILSLPVDAGRLVLGNRKPTAARLVLFLWVYLLGEVWALLALAGSRLLPGDDSARVARLQVVWASWNLAAVRSIFKMTFSAENTEAVMPAPVVVLSRHASIIDSLLPAVYISRRHGIRLRYVLKKELLVDPALDIAGHRLPNHFVARRSGATEEVTALGALASDLRHDEGVVIYPEGTRFSREKLARARVPSSHRTEELVAIAAGFSRVLPPRIAGPLAVISSNDADVVVLAHRGLESFARVKDVWAGAAVGTRVDVGLWRVPRSEIPTSENERAEWLYRTWAEVDAWVGRGDPTR